MMTNKVMFMIVKPTNPKINRYVILNKAVSTILTTSIYQYHKLAAYGVVCKNQKSKRWQHTPLISFLNE